MMKTLATRYPLLFATSATLAGVLGMLWPFWLPGLSTTLQVVLARVTIVLIAIGLLSGLHWWREAGFGRPASWRVILPYIPLALLAVLPLGLLFISGIKVTDPNLILLGAFNFLCGAFIEEAIFRGVVFRALLPGGLWRATLLGATIFATAHLAGLAVGADPAAVAAQWAYTWLFGFAAIAPLARTRNIWPLVVIHFVLNYSSFLQSGDMFNRTTPTLAGLIVPIILTALPAAYGFWLMPWNKRPDSSHSQPAAGAPVGQRG
jgi:membrane protease YdiL (CAAX protease family)